MGLDIHKNKPCSKENADDSIQIFSDNTNKAVLALFEKFKDFVVDETEEIYNINEKTSNGFVYSGMMLGEDDSCYLLFEKDEVSYKFASDTFPIDKIPVKRLYYKEICYQRKGMKKSFYTDILSGCWYVEETEKNHDDSNDVIFTNELFQLSKTHCEEWSSYKDWILNADEFILYSY